MLGDSLAYKHKPVMVEEVLEALSIYRDGSYLDCTLGYGGHASAICALLGPNGQFFGIDRDIHACNYCRETLHYENSTLIHGNYSDLNSFFDTESMNGILFDLGYSSVQLDSASRGFSMYKKGPIDMRANLQDKVTAMEVLHKKSAKDLSHIFRNWGDEKNSAFLARIIKTNLSSLKTTTDLADLIVSNTAWQKKGMHPATRVFHALKTEVNQDVYHLKYGLEAAWRLLKSKGRYVIITFNPVEDRIVKLFMRNRVTGCANDFFCNTIIDGENMDRKIVNKKEVSLNSRSRSAKVRSVMKI